MALDKPLRRETVLVFHGLLDKAESFVLNDVQPVESVLVIQPNTFRQLYAKPIMLWATHCIHEARK